MRLVALGPSAWILLLLLALAPRGLAEEASPAEAEPAAGHSVHGEAFNEGPRQQAYLMSGLGQVKFPVTTTSPQAQEFVTQGVAQLHGFWYFEAERSFRQAAALDPNCAMAYWGMAMANDNNQKRAQGFIQEAIERKDAVSERERMYIEALDAYLNGKQKEKKARSEKYTKALEKLLYKYPDDVEARALLALQLWKNRSAGIPITSHLAVDALLDQVFAVQPMHPAHHYRIHLWDLEEPEKALASAARCGESSPAIAHMWHMPGHIYSRLKRYHDAAWQQEASARVDHAHMMRDRVMPDQIHNFAHNNEWLIRNLNHVGRVQDAIDLAINMIQLPRHPQYNTLSKRGSAYYGRLRLFETLNRYELWDELLRLAETPYLEPSEDDDERVKHLRYVGSAAARSGCTDRAQSCLAELREAMEKEQQARDKALVEAEEKLLDSAALEQAVEAAAEKARSEGVADQEIAAQREQTRQQLRQEQLAAKKEELEKTRKDAEKPFKDKLQNLERAVAEIEGHLAAAAGDWTRALERLQAASDVDPMYLAYVQFRAGEADKALERAAKHVKSHGGEVQPLAMYVQLLWEADRQADAREQFETLRGISATIDLQTPVFQRLAPIAAAMDLPQDWRQPLPQPDDVADRPSLEELGPFQWEPSAAPEWELADAEGSTYSLKQFQGQPVVLIFYLGYGCLHCAEQLQAFVPLADQFREAGLQLIAISTDDRSRLKMSLNEYGEDQPPIPLLSDADLNVFRAYRAYDDFENQPLHGTFLIDGQGRVRWQDVSYQPFMDPEFVIQEARRLLTEDRCDHGSTSPEDQ